MSKQFRGFARMSEEKRKTIAANGGRKSHANGTAYKWTSETAKIASHIGRIKRKQNKLKAKLDA